jgi:hypothetical protein
MLPTASLGSMPSLNVPTHIPVTVVNKQPKLWQQVLAGVLAQAAGQAAGQGVGNAMSRDYAGEYGDAGATGFDKLLQGPKVSEKEHGRRQSQKHDKELTGTRHENDVALERLRRTPGPRDRMAREDHLATRIDNRAIADQRTNLDKTQHEETIKLQREIATQGNESRMALEALRAALERGDPKNVATTRNLEAQATGQEGINRLMGGMAGNGQVAQGQGTTTPPPSKNLQTFAGSASARTGISSSKPEDRSSAIIQQLLDHGATPEQVAAIISGPQAQSIVNRPNKPVQRVLSPEEQVRRILAERMEVDVNMGSYSH